MNELTQTSSDADNICDWWQTSIIDMQPGQINFRGQPIQELIGNISFAQMIGFMTVGEILTPAKASLLEAALVAGVDHGPQAPSIATARMAATCGISLNNIMATSINMLGDVHGGAGEQCAQLFYDTAQHMQEVNSLAESVRIELTHWQNKHGKIVAGFGHRFHKPEDPRAPSLMQLVRKAAAKNIISGIYADIGETIQKQIGTQRGQPIAMNIDGATAVIFCELGFPAPLARGLFCVSRSIGILAHAWEQMQQGGRNKGPMPPQYLPTYKAPSPSNSSSTTKK